MPSDLRAETHQFHAGLLAGKEQFLDFSNPESVFRFNLHDGPAGEHRGTCSLFSPFAPSRCIMGNVVISPCIMGTVVIFPFLFLERLLPSVKFIRAANSSFLFTPA